MLCLYMLSLVYHHCQYMYRSIDRWATDTYIDGYIDRYAAYMHTYTLCDAIQIEL